MDRRYKLVRRYQVTDAAVHNRQVVDDILDPDNTASEVWGSEVWADKERIDYEWSGGSPVVGTLYSAALIDLLGPAR